MSTNSRTRLFVLSLVFIFSYLSIWCWFALLGIYERANGDISALGKFFFGVVGVFGYSAHIISVPFQLVLQEILEFFHLTQVDAFGVVTYPHWVRFFVTAATVTSLAAIISWAFLHKHSKRAI